MVTAEAQQKRSLPDWWPAVGGNPVSLEERRGLSFGQPVLIVLIIMFRDFDFYTHYQYN